MWIVFNDLGCSFLILVVLVGALVRWLASLVWGHSDVLDHIVLATGSVLAALMDLGYRTANHREAGLRRFLYPSTGGQLWFIPLWVWGCLCLRFAWVGLFQ